MTKFYTFTFIVLHLTVVLIIILMTEILFFSSRPFVLSGVSDAAAEVRRRRRLLALWPLRLLHLPGGHGAVGGVLLPGGGGHVGWTRLRVGVLPSSRLFLFRKCNVRTDRGQNPF